MHLASFFNVYTNYLMNLEPSFLAKLQFLEEEL
jgi:hypothetical protein